MRKFNREQPQIMWAEDGSDWKIYFKTRELLHKASKRYWGIARKTKNPLAFMEIEVAQRYKEFGDKELKDYHAFVNHKYEIKYYPWVVE